MAANKYWVRSAAGDWAQVEGAAERDRWAPFGWAQQDGEPAATDQVWMRADGIEQPARFPWGSRDYFTSRGWVAGAPPEPVDLTRDPDSPAPAPAAPAAVTEPAVKSASVSVKEGK